MEPDQKRIDDIRTRRGYDQEVAYLLDEIKRLAARVVETEAAMAERQGKEPPKPPRRAQRSTREASK